MCTKAGCSLKQQKHEFLTVLWGTYKRQAFGSRAQDEIQRLPEFDLEKNVTSMRRPGRVRLWTVGSGEELYRRAQKSLRPTVYSMSS